MRVRASFIVAHVLGASQTDFIDTATRGVSVSFNIYNAALDAFTVVQAVVEFSPTR